MVSPICTVWPGPVLSRRRSGTASMIVTVGSLGVTVSGSSVSTLAKLPPDTVPWLATLLTPAGSGGPFTVTRKRMTTRWFAGSVPMASGKFANCGAAAAGVGVSTGFGPLTSPAAAAVPREVVAARTARASPATWTAAPGRAGARASPPMLLCGPGPLFVVRTAWAALGAAGGNTVVQPLYGSPAALSVGV